MIDPTLSQPADVPVINAQSLGLDGELLAQGIDSPLVCTKYANAIVASGVSFVGRYYRSAISKWPTLQAGEVQALHGAGLQVVALFESASTTLSHFSYRAGVAEGASAYHQALMAGQPPQTPVYFAVDYDAADADLAGGIDDYFRGLQDGFNTISSGTAEYLVGAYGSTRTCARLMAFSRASYFWLAESTGWGGRVLFNDWNIKQSIASGSVVPNYDANEGRTEFGAF